jgi:hypothetical protein
VNSEMRKDPKIDVAALPNGAGVEAGNLQRDIVLAIGNGARVRRNERCASREGRRWGKDLAVYRSKRQWAGIERLQVQVAVIVGFAVDPRRRAIRRVTRLRRKGWTVRRIWYGTISQLPPFTSVWGSSGTWVE